MIKLGMSVKLHSIGYIRTLYKNERETDLTITVISLCESRIEGVLVTT